MASYFANTWAMLRLPRVRQVLAVTAVEGALVFGAMSFAPTHLHEQFDLSVLVAGSVMMLYGLGGLLYSQLARRWLVWLGGERGLVKTGAASIVLGMVLLAWAQQPVWGMLACLATGFGFYMLHNTLQVQATQMAPASRGTAVTLFACGLFFGQSSGVVIMADSVDRGWLPYAFTVAAVGVALLGVLVHRLVGRHGVSG
jgi:predicted MFS family arabinose efflux permease